MGTERIRRPDSPPVHRHGRPEHGEAAATETDAEATPLPDSLGPGTALPDPTMGRMRTVFGQDFSDVRVHTDAAADESARAEGAQAYTVGHDIVFATDKFAPHTNDGERLLAHELGHVLEQRATGRHRLARQPVQQQLPETQADHRDDVALEIQALRRSAELYGVRDPRRGPLTHVALDAVPRLLADWLRMRDWAATVIATKLGGDAALTTQLRAAYRDAVRALLTWAGSAVQRGQAGGAGRPSTDELYLRHQQLIHAWAWPEARLDPHRNDLLDAVPQAERARIRIDTEERNIQRLANVLSGDAIIPALPQGTVVRVAPGIPPGQRQALANLAQFMVTSGTPLLLGVNRSKTVRLDLSAQGGGRGTYRLTQVRHPAAHGRPVWREVLVEHLATLGPERDQTKVQLGGRELFDSHGFTRDDSWSHAEFAQLLGALATIPESMLAGLDGIRFLRVAELPKKFDAEYYPDHSIRVANSAFPRGADPLPAYQGPHQPAGAFQQLIAHEIGHAIAARKQVRQADKAARAALRAARGEVSEFRAAAGRDGRTRITTYTDESWREYYAESFSLYITDPEGLQRLRPNVYRFFAQRHPDPDRLP
jgi:hypothetical protein